MFHGLECLKSDLAPKVVGCQVDSHLGYEFFYFVLGFDSFDHSRSEAVQASVVSYATLVDCASRFAWVQCVRCVSYDFSVCFGDCDVSSVN